MNRRSRLLVVALVVFALAVGVLLGSGPLRARLAGEGAADAHSQAQAAQEQAEAARAQAQLGEEFADAVGPAAVAGWLDNRSVAVVRTADVTESQLAAASARLADAGATVGATVALTEDWDSEARAPFRDALAQQITDSLAEPPTGATSSQVLAAALAQALVPATDFVTPEDEESAQTLWALLTDGGLVTGTRDAASDVFVLVAGPAGAEIADIGAAFVAHSNGTVAAFTGDEASAAGGAPTVTNGASFYGAWAVTGALINHVNGTGGSYDASDAPRLIGGLGQ